MLSNFSLYQKFWHSTLYIRKKIGKTISGTILYIGIIYFLVFIYDLGFEQSIQEESYLRTFYRCVKWILVLSFLGRNILNIFNKDKPVKIKILDGAILCLLLFLVRLYSEGSTLSEIFYFLPSYKFLVTPLFSSIFIIEYSRNAVNFYSRRINPYLILVLSFLVIIFLGGVLLSLPNSTYRHISLVDTFFTATAAVCVTGLTVIDISKDLSMMGQIILLCLIQIGGLGVMTFASFIGFMFSGKNVSFQQRLILRDLANSQKMNDVISSVYKIVGIMLTIEALGVFLIWYAVPDHVFEHFGDKLFFSIFHSVSAFCNAGLSNFPEGLHHVDLRFQPILLLNISFLIICGGIGFPIMLNLMDYIKLWFKNLWNFIVHRRRFTYIPYIIHLNSRIILYSTAALLAIGFFSILLFEYDGVLSEFSFGEKLAVSFFTSATTRTAGFGILDFSAIQFPTYIIIILLMWIGASPGGTGGGVKTTTFTVMFLNFWSQAKGEKDLILENRKISNYSINKSFAIVMMSLLVIGFSVLLMIYFDPNQTMEAIVFESFSAFSTAGLSQGITKSLSNESKLVIMMLMLIGRVGSLAFIAAFFYKSGAKRVKYPQQDIQF